MRSFGFFTPVGAWLLLLIPPLVLFYFLKLKRPRVIVPSLVLWRRVIADRRVNSPFQRFKRNILLLLQLLVLLLLILAAMQPYFRSRESRMHRRPVLIDCSASMAAMDRPGGTSRLDAAKARVSDMIENLLPDQELCIISFSGSARRRTGFTNSQRVLREAVDHLVPEAVASDVEDALRMTDALSRTASFDEVVLLSDGNFPARTNVDLAFELNYQKLPGAGPNAGITAFNAKRTTQRRWEVFVEICGSAEDPVAGDLKVSAHGEPLLEEPFSVAWGAPERFVVRVDGDQAVSLTATLTPADFDSLGADNAACLSLPRARPLVVSVAPDLVAFRHCLSALSDVRVVEEAGDGGVQSSDLAVVSGGEDSVPGAPTVLELGVVPADLQDLVEIEAEGDEVVDWDRGSALLRHVELRDVVFLERPRLTSNVFDADLENRGYRPLAHGRNGPLILRKVSDTQTRFSFLFRPSRSTLPYRIGFPIMVSNAVQIAVDRAGIGAVNGLRTGVLPPMDVVPGASYRITTPSGQTLTAEAGASGILGGILAPEAGWYKIDGRGAVGVALLDEGETELEGREEIQFTEDLTIGAANDEIKTEKPLWSSLALLGFFAMLAEWWYYQRRSGG